MWLSSGRIPICGRLSFTPFSQKQSSPLNSNFFSAYPLFCADIYIGIVEIRKCVWSFIDLCGVFENMPIWITRGPLYLFWACLLKFAGFCFSNFIRGNLNPLDPHPHRTSNLPRFVLCFIKHVSTDYWGNLCRTWLWPVSSHLVEWPNNNCHRRGARVVDNAPTQMCSEAPRCVQPGDVTRSVVRGGMWQWPLFRAYGKCIEFVYFVKRSVIFADVSCL